MWRLPIPEAIWNREPGEGGGGGILPGEYVLTYDIPDLVAGDTLLTLMRSLIGISRESEGMTFTLTDVNLVNHNDNMFIETQVNMEKIPVEDAPIIQYATPAHFFTGVGILIGGALLAYSLTKIERIMSGSETFFILGGVSAVLYFGKPYFKFAKGFLK